MMLELWIEAALLWVNHHLTKSNHSFLLIRGHEYFPTPQPQAPHNTEHSSFDTAYGS